MSLFQALYPNTLPSDNPFEYKDLNKKGEEGCEASPGRHNAPHPYFSHDPERSASDPQERTVRHHSAGLVARATPRRARRGIPRFAGVAVPVVAGPAPVVVIIIVANAALVTVVPIVAASTSARGGLTRVTVAPTPGTVPVLVGVATIDTPGTIPALVAPTPVPIVVATAAIDEVHPPVVVVRAIALPDD